jgi:ATP-dependent helicase/nuclease subunit A
LALHMDTDQTKQIEQIKDEVFHILDHPDYAPLFSEHSKAEVPLTGIVSLPTGEKTVISGQIDRLYIDPATQLVMIVDYKTNRPAPRDSANIPRVYRKQMQSYRSLLEQLYPDYNIETYILWTDHGMMMDCPPL